MTEKSVSYTIEELTEALRAINSIIHKCEKPPGMKINQTERLFRYTRYQ